MSPEKAKELQKAINALVAAAIEESWAGGGDPSDRPALEANLIIARAKVNRLINSLTIQPPVRIL